MVKRQIGHATEQVTVTLHNYESIDALIANMQTPPTLNPMTLGRKWMSSYEQTNVPYQLTLSDLRIEKEYSYSIQFGENTWVRVTVYTRFGIPEQQWINQDILGEPLPWTVWIPEPGQEEREQKYGINVQFCGLLFKSEAEAQEWIDHQN